MQDLQRLREILVFSFAAWLFFSMAELHAKQGNGDTSIGKLIADVEWQLDRANRDGSGSPADYSVMYGD